MKPQPRISVIMPVYNGEKTLESAMTSILSQTYSDFEFIVINDGSKDASREIMNRLASMDSRIQVIDRPNKGLIASLNEGIDLAAGEFLARMDADDLSLPDRFRKQVECMDRERLDICGCHFLVIDDVGKVRDTAVMPVEKAMMPVWLSVGTPFAHGSVLMRKSFLERTGLRYGQSFSQVNEDLGLWMLMFSKGAVLGNVDEVLFKYRWHPNSFSHTKLARMSVDNIRLWWEFFRLHVDDVTRCYRELLDRIPQLSSMEKAFLVKSSFFFLICQRSGWFFRIASRMNPSITLIHSIAQLNHLARYFWVTRFERLG